MNKHQRVFTVDDTLRMMQAVVVLSLWPITTLAATQSLGDALYGIGLRDWISLLLLTNVSGLVALLTRVRKSLEAVALMARGQTVDAADIQLVPWWFFALVHMLGAMFVGALMFFVAEYWDWNSYIEAPAIALTSWGGAKYVDRLADAWSDSLINRLIGAFKK